MKAEQSNTIIEMKDPATPRLRPCIHPRIQELLKKPDMIFSLTDKFGSPLNLIFPQNIRDNVHAFQGIYKKYSLRGRIYFTSKPCKSRALFEDAKSEDIGIDVSSAGSLQTVMECGWNADRIGATGPKNKAYILLALKNDVLINVDNIDELKQIAACHTTLSIGKKARITIRIADCGPSNVRFLNEDDTTFGIRTEDMDWVFFYLKEREEIFDLLGFSWHSSTASDEQRIAAMDNQLRLTFDAIKRGFKISVINIGGGFPIMYADSCQEWADYTLALKESVMGKIPSQVWNRGGLGFRMENGVLKGSGVFSNHAPFDDREEDLEKRLNYRMPSMGNSTFADIVRDSLLKLSIEPGSGMVDQCGITIGRVAFTKKSAFGENIVGLEMNRSNLHSNQLKQLAEPVVLTRYANPAPADGKGVFYVGNLCLSYDMLQYNKTYPAFMPQPDDLVAFMNTAAYMMDFTESETLMQPVARKIALTEENNVWQWQEDKDYRRKP